MSQQQRQPPQQKAPRTTGQSHPRHDPNAARIQALDRHYLAIYQQVARLRAAEKTLSARWQLWHQQRLALDSEKPQVFVQGVISAFGGPNLLPNAQNWHYRNQNLQRAAHRLHEKEIEIKAQLEVCEQELYLIDLEIELLRSY